MERDRSFGLAAQPSRDAEIVHGYAQELYVWDEPKPGPEPLRIEWGMVGHDSRKGFSYHEFSVPPPVMVRGDANRDGTVDVSDGISIVTYLFSGGTSDCPAQMDIDADGEVALCDAVLEFEYREIES